MTTPNKLTSEEINSIAFFLEKWSNEELAKRLKFTFAELEEELKQAKVAETSGRINYDIAQRLTDQLSTKDREIERLIKEHEDLRSMLDLHLKDWAEDDTTIRDIARKVLSKDKVDDDGYAVIGITDVVQNLYDQLAMEIERLKADYNAAVAEFVSSQQRICVLTEENNQLSRENQRLREALTSIQRGTWSGSSVLLPKHKIAELCEQALSQSTNATREERFVNVKELEKTIITLNGIRLLCEYRFNQDQLELARLCMAEAQTELTRLQQLISGGKQ